VAKDTNKSLVACCKWRLANSTISTVMCWLDDRIRKDFVCVENYYRNQQKLALWDSGLPSVAR